MYDPASTWGGKHFGRLLQAHGATTVSMRPEAQALTVELTPSFSLTHTLSLTLSLSLSLFFPRA